MSFELSSKISLRYATEKSLNDAESIVWTRFALNLLQTVAKRCLLSHDHLFYSTAKTNGVCFLGSIVMSSKVIICKLCFTR